MDEVQGASFTLFVLRSVFRIVRTLNLKGWMRPQVSGFDLELEGDESTLVAFEKRMLAMQKRHGWSISLQSQWVAFQGDTSFENLAPLPQVDEGCWLPPIEHPVLIAWLKCSILTSVDFSIPTPAARNVARAIHGLDRGLWIACKPFFRSMCLVNNARQRRTNRELDAFSIR